MWTSLCNFVCNKLFHRPELDFRRRDDSCCDIYGKRMKLLDRIWNSNGLLNPTKSSSSYSMHRENTDISDDEDCCIIAEVPRRKRPGNSVAGQRVSEPAPPSRTLPHPIPWASFSFQNNSSDKSAKEYVKDTTIINKLLEKHENTKVQPRKFFSTQRASLSQGKLARSRLSYRNHLRRKMNFLQESYRLTEKYQYMQLLQSHTTYNLMTIRNPLKSLKAPEKPVEVIDLSEEDSSNNHGIDSKTEEQEEEDVQILGEVSGVKSFQDVLKHRPMNAAIAIQEISSDQYKIGSDVLRLSNNTINLVEDVNINVCQKADTLEEELRNFMQISGPTVREVESGEPYYLPELKPDQERKIKNALIPHPSREVLSGAFGLQITRQDMQTLVGLNWLNDEVQIINFYMNLIMERSKTNTALPKVYAFNTFFYPKLVSCGYTSLRRWTKQVDIFSFDIILVPVHLGMHWCLSVIDFRSKSVKYYDSVGAPNDPCLERLLLYLKAESLDKRKRSYPTFDWNKSNVDDIPQQMNGGDCGVFCCMFAEHLARDCCIMFTQDDMPYFRKKMADECEDTVGSDSFSPFPDRLKMFPPNLQKNIQELERQISLLETECEHMEAEKQELSGMSNSKSTVRELPNQPFITGPSQSVGSYSSKMLTLPPVSPRMYSASCAHFRTTSDKFSRATTPKSAEDSRSNRSVGFNDCQPPEEPANDEKTNELVAEPCERENKKTCQRSIGSIKEVSESSEENYSPRVSSSKSKQKNNSNPKEQTWCELLRQPSPPHKRQETCKNKTSDSLSVHASESKLSSDEECKKELISGKSRSLSGNWLREYETQVSSPSKLFTKRRPRSARTKKNSADEIPMDLNVAKTLLEKEIQCVLWKEVKDKEEFFSGLNESINVLHLLIGELKTKLSREKREDVLNDMQNTLLKLSGIQSMSLTSLKETALASAENEENVLDVKHTLIALKQFCQELSDEKSALTEEIAVKNRTLANFKTKEKEYLSLISSLKFNLEKMKEEADEGAHAKRDLKILKIKLQEETKVIEALKKSHEKMQELIENYVLENDKLRAQVKIAKLESQKFNVLLAGKEAEITKYKKEIETFQKQISEQLSLLRSKATENEVEQTIETISNQRNIIRTEVDTFRGQRGGTTFDDDESNGNLNDSNIESSTTIIQRKSEAKDSSPSGDQPGARTKNEWETQSNSTGEGRKQQDGTAAESTPNESEGEVQSTKRQYGLERVLSSSKNLRSSINELLQDIRRESSEMYWLSPSNSCVTSSQSVLITTSSEDISEGDQNN